MNDDDRIDRSLYLRLHEDPGEGDETVLVLDCDDWRMSVSRDELPNGIDVEALPVTSV